MKCLPLICGIVVVSTSLLFAQNPSGRPALPPNVAVQMEYLLPRHTLKEQWASALLVAEIEVSQTTQTFIDSPLIVHPILKHDARVINIFKDDARSPKQHLITVAEPGGAVLVRGTTFVAEVRDTQPLRVGMKAIVFLVDYPALKTYSAAFGPASVFGYEKDEKQLWIHPNARGVKEIADRAFIAPSDFKQILKTFEKQ